MERHQKNLRIAGIGIILLGVVYFIGIAFFFHSFGDVIAAIAAEQLPGENVEAIIRLVATLIAAVLGGVQVVCGAAVLLTSRKPGKWIGSLVWGILMLLFSISSLWSEIASPSVITILPVLQIAASAWVISSALSIRKLAGNPL